MVRILVAPDPEEALSFLSSPAHGLPFLWLFAIAKHVSNRPFANACKRRFSRHAERRNPCIHRLNRQAERFAREGVELSLSTLVDLVGQATVALQPIHALIEAHVLAAHLLHGDDTTVPLLARGGAKKAWLWTYVRDDRPWNGGAPPAAFFQFSRDRAATNPNQHLAGWQGVLQADAYGGYNGLYHADRDAGPVTSALCWAHARRKFFELADIAGNVRKGKPAHQISPVALEAVKI